jgi:hypothetical protein
MSSNDETGRVPEVGPLSEHEEEFLRLIHLLSMRKVS